MPIKLRPYQVDVIDKLKASMAQGNRRVCGVLPTGSGKSAVIAEIVRRAYLKGHRVYINVHRQELVDQLSHALLDVNIPHARLEAGVEADINKKVSVNSIPTLVRRLEKMPAPTLNIFDETHHIRANSWQRVADTYKSAHMLGFTATPIRNDSRGLGEMFDSLVVGPSVSQLIEMGYLCKYRYFAREFDMSEIKVTAGDFQRGETVAALRKAKITGNLIEEYKQYCDGKRMLVFTPSVEFSKDLAAQFCDSGIAAAEVDGGTPRLMREMTLERFKNGDLRVLVNCELYTEGVDCPGVEAIGILRPTESMGLHRQIIGRGLRIHPGKDTAYIFDHVGNVLRHGLPKVDIEWSLTMDKEKRDTETVPSVTLCRECFATLPSAMKVCPYCKSVKTVKKKVIRTEKGRLREIKEQSRLAQRLKDEEIKQQKKEERWEIETYEDAVAYAEKWGYHRNWPTRWCNAKGIAITASDSTGQCP